MTHATSFNTLHYANRLKKAGIPDRQAEAQADALADIMEEKFIARQEFKLRISELKNELIKWLLSVTAAQAILIVACLKLIP